MSNTLALLDNEPYAPLNARIVRQGETFGLSGSLFARKNMIEFWDARYAGDQFGFDPELGQFIARYNVDTLLSDTERLCDRLTGGLNLHMGVPEWSVTAGNIARALAWASEELGL